MQQNRRRAAAAVQLVGDEEVVDAPADVPGARAALQIPPRIVPGLAREEAKRVVVALGDEPAHPGALALHEAGRPLVFLRAGEVDLGVGGIDVAADNHALAQAPQALRHLDELVVELELVGKPLGPHAAIGEVDVEEMKVGQLRVDDTALAVERGGAALGGDGARLLPRIGDDAAIPLLLGEAPVGPVAVGGAHLVGELVFLDLGLLDAEDVRELGGQEIGQPLLPRGAQAVDVP
jgi:hypothetical protein